MAVTEPNCAELVDAENENDCPPNVGGTAATFVVVLLLLDGLPNDENVDFGTTTGADDVSPARFCPNATLPRPALL